MVEGLDSSVSESEFVRTMKDISTLGSKAVTVAKDDFMVLIRLAERGLVPHDCICTVDQYGCAVNPLCKLHGDAAHTLR